MILAPLLTYFPPLICWGTSFVNTCQIQVKLCNLLYREDSKGSSHGSPGITKSARMQNIYRFHLLRVQYKYIKVSTAFPHSEVILRQGVPLQRAAGLPATRLHCHEMPTWAGVDHSLWSVPGVPELWAASGPCLGSPRRSGSGCSLRIQRCWPSGLRLPHACGLWHLSPGLTGPELLGEPRPLCLDDQSGGCHHGDRHTLGPLHFKGSGPSGSKV